MSRSRDSSVPAARLDAAASDDPPPRRRVWRGHSRMTLNLTAMIDVVFLLMIYFMVATEFKTNEEAYRLDLPARPSSASHDPFDLDQEPLRIEVVSTGAVAYRLHIDGPYPQPATFDELRAVLAERRIGPGATIGLFEADHPVVVVPAPSTRWEHAIGAFNAVARARYENITLAPPS